MSISTSSPQVPATTRAAVHVAPKKELRVISYSLYGKKKESTDYTQGMINAARRAVKIFPGWQIRIYHDNNIPDEVLDQLSTIGGSAMKLINVVTDMESWVYQDLNPMAWRFLVASDEKVSAFIVRDGDSRPGMRDKAAVDEWLRSGRSFHIIRDHPMHNPTTFTPILGGMWGALGGALPQMERLLRTHYAGGKQRRTDGRPGFKYAEDQNFLWQEVVPLAFNDCFQHDSYFCREANAVAFPVDRTDNDYVGNDFSLPDKIVVDPRLTTDDYGDRYNACLDDRKTLEAKFGDNFAEMVNTTFAGPIKGSSTEVWSEFNRKKREAQGIVTHSVKERGKVKLNFLKDKKKEIIIGV